MHTLNRQLETLEMERYGMEFTGGYTFPTLVLSKLSNLRTLTLYGHDFTGPPSALPELPQLDTLKL